MLWNFEALVVMDVSKEKSDLPLIGTGRQANRRRRERKRTGSDRSQTAPTEFELNLH